MEDKPEMVSVEWTHRHYVQDDEYIPDGENIEAFLEREIAKPIIRWEDSPQFGYEILPNKYFYRYQPPTPAKGLARGVLAAGEGSGEDARGIGVNREGTTRTTFSERFLKRLDLSTSLKDVVSLRSDKTFEATADEDYLELEDIESGTGRILSRRNTLEVESAVTIFRKGDILFGKLQAIS